MRLLINVCFLHTILINAQAFGDSEHSMRLARQECGKCHAFPQPDSMFRKDWEKAAFPYLEDLLGFDQLANYDNVTQEDVRKRWELIKSYYLTNSPSKTPSKSLNQSISSLFGHRNSALGLDVTAIHHNPELGLVFVGDAIHPIVLCIVRVDDVKDKLQ